MDVEVIKHSDTLTLGDVIFGSVCRLGGDVDLNKRTGDLFIVGPRTNCVRGGTILRNVTGLSCGEHFTLPIATVVVEQYRHQEYKLVITPKELGLSAEVNRTCCQCEHVATFTCARCGRGLCFVHAVQYADRPTWTMCINDRETCDKISAGAVT